MYKIGQRIAVDNLWPYDSMTIFTIARQINPYLRERLYLISKGNNSNGVYYTAKQLDAMGACILCDDKKRQ